MKKSSREVNVFSVSALDLFASALGAFILMALIFMVFFSIAAESPAEAVVPASELEDCRAELASVTERNDVLEAQLAGTVDTAALERCQQRVETVRGRLAQCQDELGAARDELGGLNEDLADCRSALAQTFVLVIASWASREDVDLHVVDPAGREFYFSQREHRGSDGKLEEDNTRGPGNEVWLHPSAEAGRYRICYKLYSGQSSTVRGSVLWQEGRIEIPNIRLERDDQVKLALELDLDEDGRVRAVRSRSGEVLGSDDCA
ncbi:MAG: hypothetical protein OXI49_18225 [Acidobacteriota bacterium]|nr:hypothetical protein [Acidobacteriota bacterium]